MLMLADDDEMLAYVNAKLYPIEPGSFLKAFLEACQRADHENYPMLRPVLKALSVKYPAHPQRLAEELERIRK